jgi:membrane protein YdbS with pleckstrin-like domain
MAFPRKLLAPGEEVVLETHPNWSILVPRATLFVVIVAGCVGVVVAWTGAPLWVGWALLGIAVVFLLALLAKVIVWRSTTLVLTSLRVVYRTGALRRLGREIPLDRVQDVTYSQSILERMVGAGSLTIESAGAHGDEPFPDIRHPAVVQSLINRLITQPGGGLGGTGGRGYPQSPGPPPYQPPAQAPYQPPAPYQQPGQYPPAQGQYQPAQYRQAQYQQAQEQPPYQGQPAQYQPPYQQPPHPQPILQQQPQPQQPQPYDPPTQPHPIQPPPESPASAQTGPPEGFGAAEPLLTSSSEELQRLGELHRLGVITDAEYAQKRQELIGP